ncbi:MAG: transposase family protein [Betaproteobacteria bacterium]|nr:transposase family protein [Betaproteobacteria bacterium]
MTLQEAFSEGSGHRREPAVRYERKKMTVMAICAVSCGCDDRVDVVDWREEEEGRLRTFLVLAK